MEHDKVKVRLGYLSRSSGSVLTHKPLPPKDPIYGDSDVRCAGYVVSVQGPAALESPRNELYDRLNMKFHISPLASPPSVWEGEEENKLSIIFSQAIRMTDLPRTGLFFGIQTLGDHDFTLLVNSITLALLDAAVPMYFVPVAVQLPDDENSMMVVKAFDPQHTIIYQQKNGIVVDSPSPSFASSSFASSISEACNWLINNFSQKRHFSPDLKR